MKLKIDTTNVSFTCTRAPEPRTNFQTSQPRVDEAAGASTHFPQETAY